MIKPSDGVIVSFPGAIKEKKRPAVIVSTDLYHENRPDTILQEYTRRGPDSYKKKDARYLFCQQSH